LIAARDPTHGRKDSRAGDVAVMARVIGTNTTPSDPGQTQAPDEQAVSCMCRVSKRHKGMKFSSRLRAIRAPQENGP
ncbi:MAG TPA: hypothetical protein VMM36_11355, partial [Opitutaceae bacterium]|nr:hypothetical protein [Opitutaceae bacterium]